MSDISDIRADGCFDLAAALVVKLSDRGLMRLVAQFEQKAAQAETLLALQALIEAAALEIGFTYVGLVQHVSFHKPSPRLIHIDNYPEVWRVEFVQGKLFQDDPVLQFSRRTGKAFTWEDIGTRMTLQRQHLHVLERSGRFGMGGGFTVPCNLHGEPSASCSFAVKRGRSLPLHCLRAAELIGIDALDAARRIEGLTPPDAIPRLSPRQKQVLRLVAAGKTDWEIAMILGISFETARRYMKSLRAAYDVVTRTQLVAYALRDGQIGFDDAIAPFG